MTTIPNEGQTLMQTTQTFGCVLLTVAALTLSPSTSYAQDSTTCSARVAAAKQIASDAIDKAELEKKRADEATAQRDDAIGQRDTYRAQRDTARTERDNCAGELAARSTDVLRLNQAVTAAVEDNARLTAAVKRLKRSRVVLAVVSAGVGVGVGAFFVMWAR